MMLRPQSWIDEHHWCSSACSCAAVLGAHDLTFSSISSRTASGRHQIASVASELLARVLELRQHFETFFCAARQHELFVDKLQTVVRDRHQVTAHAEKTADREHGIWILSVGAHEEIVDLTNGFIGVVGNAGTDDLRRAIAGR